MSTREKVAYATAAAASAAALWQHFVTLKNMHEEMKQKEKATIEGFEVALDEKREELANMHEEMKQKEEGALAEIQEQVDRYKQKIRELREKAGERERTIIRLNADLDRSEPYNFDTLMADSAAVLGDAN